MKAPGIGNSCNAFMGPATYQKGDQLEEIKHKLQKEKFEKIAVTDWHRRLFEKDKEKEPKAFPQLSSKLVKPGPGHYTAEQSKAYKRKADFANVNQPGFGRDAKRKIHEVNSEEHPNVYVPGPGTYGKIKQHTRKKQDFTSNMMSHTGRVLNG